MKSIILHIVFFTVLASCSTNSTNHNEINTTDKQNTQQAQTKTNENTVAETTSEKQENTTPTLLIKSDAVEPHYCPDGSMFFYLNDKGNQLTVFNTKTNESKVVLQQEGLKNNVSWAKNCQTILYKYKENYKMKFGSVNINGNKTQSFTDYPALTSVASLQYSDTIFYLDQKSLSIKAKYQNNEWNFGNEKQRYYNLLASPNGRYLAANNGSEIVLIDLKTNTESILGKGLHTSWHPLGNYLIGFLDESTDGHNISNSDIFLWDVNTGKQTQITNTKDIFEAYPNFKNNTSIIYSDMNKEGIYELNISNFIK